MTAEQTKDHVALHVASMSRSGSDVLPLDVLKAELMKPGRLPDDLGLLDAHPNEDQNVYTQRRLRQRKYVRSKHDGKMTDAQADKAWALIVLAAAAELQGAVCEDVELDHGPVERLAGETVSAWKKRRKAQRDYIRSLTSDAISDDMMDTAWDHVRCRAEKSSRVSFGPEHRGNGQARLSTELPAGIRQLLKKGTLTCDEGDIVARFRADYDLAYYSTPGMTTNYDQDAVSGQLGGGVTAARAAVVDARERMTQAKNCMTDGCWDVLVKMTVFDIAQVNVGGAASRYKDPKGRRYAAGILLIEALTALKQIYG